MTIIVDNGERRQGMRGGVMAAGAVSIVLLAGCGSSAGTGQQVKDKRSTLTVVASTDVYGDIVRQIAGDRVQVTSLISDPNADPHSYEANTQNQLALSKAAVVIENGGGYDDFVDTMLTSSHSKATVLNAVEISGRVAPAGGELNEHVWYDYPSMQKLTERLVTALSAADPANTSSFRAGGDVFAQKLQSLEDTEATIKRAHGGQGVAVTEPVPLYALEASGLVNKTPEEFSKAIEEGSDVPASALQQTLDLFTGRQVRVLAYNEQTAGPETRKVLDAATVNGVAVLPVTETLPAGKDYVSWMSGTLTALQGALG